MLIIHSYTNLIAEAAYACSRHSGPQILTLSCGYGMSFRITKTITGVHRAKYNRGGCYPFDPWCFRQTSPQEGELLKWQQTLEDMCVNNRSGICQVPMVQLRCQRPHNGYMFKTSFQIVYYTCWSGPTSKCIMYFLDLCLL